MNRKRMFAAAAALLAAALYPAVSPALKVAKDSFQVSPNSVYLTRTFTVSVVIEDTAGQGGVTHVELEPNPARLVRLVSKDPPSFSCTISGSAAGRWVYEAIGPGEVRFHLMVNLLSCTRGEGTVLEADSPPVELMPPAIWSDLKITPRILAPGEEIEVVLSLRNDAQAVTENRLPQAQAQLVGHTQAPVEPLGVMRIEPESVVSGKKMRLPPGQVVRASWRFVARKPGEVRFFISGAGLLMMSPPTTIRLAPALELIFPEPEQARIVGETCRLAGRIRARGEPGIDDPVVSLSISPSGAARLLESPSPLRGLMPPGEEGWPLEFSLELLQSGPLHLTLSAAGREADTGRPAQPVSAGIALEVLPPPDLKLELVLDCATAIAGSKVPFSLKVVNRGLSAAASLTPAMVFSRGGAQLAPFSPLFQAVPKGSTGTFTGALIPEGDGVLEVVAHISTRGDRGGKRVAFASAPARLLVLPSPAFEFFTGHERVFAGPGRASFLLRNAGRLKTVLESASVRLAGGGYSLGADLLAGQKLELAPGQSATLSVAVEPPPAADPYWLTTGFTVAGELAPHGKTFSVVFPPRQAMLVAPVARRFILIEPPAPFRPPLDPVLQVEWTQTVSGVSGLAVIGPAGETVRVLAEPLERGAGIHSAQWYGRDAKGQPIPAGRYVLRLAGPAPDMAVWPAGASWILDSRLDVESP